MKCIAILRVKISKGAKTAQVSKVIALNSQGQMPVRELEFFPLPSLTDRLGDK
jgi:hypothetical protein